MREICEPGSECGAEFNRDTCQVVFPKATNEPEHPLFRDLASAGLPQGTTVVIGRIECNRCDFEDTVVTTRTGNASTGHALAMNETDAKDHAGMIRNLDCPRRLENRRGARAVITDTHILIRFPRRHQIC